MKLNDNNLYILFPKRLIKNYIYCFFIRRNGSEEYFISIYYILNHSLNKLFIEFGKLKKLHNRLKYNQ